MRARGLEVNHTLSGEERSASMSKKATKKVFVPVRRAVKRGAPPIIKPRRMVARGLMKARTSAGTPLAPVSGKPPSPAERPPAATTGPAAPAANDEEALEVIALSEAGGLGEA